MFKTLTIRIFLVAALCGMTALAAAEQPARPAQPPAAAAAPESDFEGRPAMGPPPEAYKACEGKASGSRSEFTDPNSERLKGVCKEDEQGRMVLRPDRAGEKQAGEHRGPPPEAYAACAGKSAGAMAQFISPRGETIAGNCEMEGSRMVLRPQHPPSHGDAGKAANREAAPAQSNKAGH